MQGGVCCDMLTQALGHPGPGMRSPARTAATGRGLLPLCRGREASKGKPRPCHRGGSGMGITAERWAYMYNDTVPGQGGEQGEGGGRASEVGVGWPQGGTGMTAAGRRQRGASCARTRANRRVNRHHKLPCRALRCSIPAQRTSTIAGGPQGLSRLHCRACTTSHHPSIMIAGKRGTGRTWAWCWCTPTNPHPHLTHYPR